MRAPSFPRLPDGRRRRGKVELDRQAKAFSFRSRLGGVDIARARRGRWPVAVLFALIPLVAAGTAALAGDAAPSRLVLDPPSPALCNDPPSRPISRVSEPGAYDISKSKLVELESDYDGEKIQMAYVRPAAQGIKTPVIVFASPYFDHTLARGNLAKCVVRLVENFVPHGYTIGFVAVRGTADSGGCSDLMGNAERADLDQAVTWFGKQPWSTGRVGMIGVSYDGSTPWEVASMGNRYLKTIVPISGVNDLYHLMYHDGANELRGPVVLNALYYQYGFLEYDPVRDGRSLEHAVKGVACPEAFKGFYAALHSTATGERDPLGYWAERNSRPGVEKRYRGSIFIARGLQDWNVDPAHDFPWAWELEEKGIYVKYLLGQWDHAWPDSNKVVQNVIAVRWDWADILLDWWDYWLKGDRSVDLGPRVQVQDSQGAWRDEETWPPSRARARSFYLSSEGRLSQRGAGGEGSRVIAPDTSAAFENERYCVACAVFDTERFERELRFAGIPRLRLRVTPTGPGGHIAAWVFAVDRDGSSRRIGWGQVDLRFADGGEEMEPVVPGRQLKVRLNIEPLDAVVPKGSILRLVLNQGSYGDHIPSVPTYPVRLDLGGRSNRLTVETFDVDRSSFFEPPLVPNEPPRR